MKTGKIDVTKIDKKHLFNGEKGTYLDMLLVENKDGRDSYGNDGYIAQGVSKEARLAGERGPIIGNWRDVSSTQSKPTGTKKPATPAAQHPADDDIAF